MNLRKIVAGIVLAVVILFPFRLAYLDQPDMGPKSFINFLLVIVGVAVFGILVSGSKSKDTTLTAEKKFEHTHKKAA
jgi:tellurite resistance protein TehA-like permease